MGKFEAERQKNLVENWYWYLTGEHKHGFTSEYEISVKRMQRTFGLLPGAPRCFECNLPMTGPVGWLTKTSRSTFSPKLCSRCEESMRKEAAGVEVELSLLFADVRGSSTLAQNCSTAEFKALIQRFYQATSEVLIRHNAMVNRLMGDQVIGLFVPRFAGSGHGKVAIAAALDILRATGHAGREGPWVPVGIGVHTGLAYVGAVGTGSGVNEIAVLGNAPNLAARLSSQAGEGEVLVSEAAVESAQLALERIETRQLDLKGISGTTMARVLRVGAQPN